MKRLIVGAALATAAALAGCNNSCQTLANNICECSATQAAQQNCEAEASIANGTATLSNDDLNRCNVLQNKQSLHRLLALDFKRTADGHHGLTEDAKAKLQAFLQ